MKHNLSLLVGAALLGLASGAVAATAVTDPVGYITVTVNPAPTGTRFSAISPTLTNKVEFSGTVASVAGKVITLTGTPLTAGAFNTPAAPGSYAKYWIEITNGTTTEGAWTNIASNDAGTITTVDDMTAAITGGTTTIKIRAHVTIGQFLGAANSAGLKGGEEPGSADEVLVMDPTDGPNLQTIFFDTAGSAWTDGETYNVVNDQPIEPGSGLLVKRKENSAASFVQVGHVKTGKTMVSAFQGSNLFGVPQATGVTFANSNLYTDGTPATSLDGGEEPGSADEVLLIPASGVIQTVFYDDTANQWTDAETFNSVATQNLAEATAFIIKRKSATPFTWTAPKQNITE